MGTKSATLGSTAGHTHAFCGQSRKRSTVAAAQDIIDQIRASFGDKGFSGVDGLLVFATALHDHETLLAILHEELNPTALSGCSGEGVIASDGASCETHAVVALAIRSSRMRFEPFLIPGFAGDIEGAAQAIAELAAAHDDAFGMWLMPDGLVGNASTLVAELGRHCDLPIAGGTAGDAMQFVRTFQYFGAEVHSDAISGVLLCGAGEMNVSVSHGCEAVGLPRTVTKVDGCWLHEIDGQPAWDVFRAYLSGSPDDLSGEGISHLCVGVPVEADGYARIIIRTPTLLNKETGALFFPSGDIEHGQQIQLARRDRQRIIESASACAERLVEEEAPAFVVQFDCAGRGRVLFGSAAGDEIVAPLQHALGASTPWVGFHTYGEIARVGGVLRYHNFTVALCAVYAR